MNIFFLSLIPQLCAQMHGDKHVIKMILESVQMLCTAYRMLNGEVKCTKQVKGCIGNTDWICEVEEETKMKPYRITHQKHGCTVWTATCQGNFLWLCHLAYWLCIEKEIRWPENQPHKSKPLVIWFLNNPPNIDLFPCQHIDCFTPPFLAMPDQYKVTTSDDEYQNAISSYQQYYVSKVNDGIVYYRRMPERQPAWLNISS